MLTLGLDQGSVGAAGAAFAVFWMGATVLPKWDPEVLDKPSHNIHFPRSAAVILLDVWFRKGEGGGEGERSVLLMVEWVAGRGDFIGSWLSLVAMLVSG